MTTTETKIKKVPTKNGTSAKKTGDKVPKTKAIKIPKTFLPVRQAGPKKEGGGDSKVILRIRVRAYESKILDSSVKQIMDTAVRHDAMIVGPVPLPTEIKKYTVNRSPFIYKNTREQFEIRVHKRLIDIINPNGKTIEALTNLSLPSGVDIDVKML
ncbi:MAG: 30S ribosomal protein S10 [Parcubacteria group bacterium GW2011_GWB1_36_5]|nr:MAG: 30S ribosomal protein S10 [Parcubacteria group bacterium GW2011_GWA2_36_24]KKQ06160.1 MAG: 30S ribosomal protein S10 [Parcubacteria group bacterium GW2011_GWB1_36_5]